MIRIALFTLMALISQIVSVYAVPIPKIIADRKLSGLPDYVKRGESMLYSSLYLKNSGYNIYLSLGEKKYSPLLPVNLNSEITWSSKSKIFESQNRTNGALMHALHKYSDALKFVQANELKKDDTTFELKYSNNESVKGTWEEKKAYLNALTPVKMKCGTANLSSDAVQGSVGLLPSSSNDTKSFSLLSSLKDQKKISESSFSIQPEGGSLLKIHYGSEPDEKYISGKMQYTNMDLIRNIPHIKIEQFEISKQDKNLSISAFHKKSTKATFDLALQELVVPYSVLYSATKLAGTGQLVDGYPVIDCSETADLGKLSFHLSFSNGSSTAVDLPLSSFSRKYKDSNICMLGLLSSPSDEVILGYDFFKHFAVYWNFDKKVFGFAPTKKTAEALKKTKD